MNCWMINIDEKNYGVTCALGYKLQGFGIRQKKKTDRMEPGDKMIYYVREWRSFVLSATITSKVFEEQTIHWESVKANEKFVRRIRFKPDLVMEKDQYVDGLQIAPRLEYLKRWPPERWVLALEGELHLLPRRDFELIEGEMKRTLGLPVPEFTEGNLRKGSSPLRRARKRKGNESDSVTEQQPVE